MLGCVLGSRGCLPAVPACCASFLLLLLLFLLLLLLLSCMLLQLCLQLLPLCQVLRQQGSIGLLTLVELCQHLIRLCKLLCLAALLQQLLLAACRPCCGNECRGGLPSAATAPTDCGVVLHMSGICPW